jgi:hypothetical protein
MQPFDWGYKAEEHHASHATKACGVGVFSLCEKVAHTNPLRETSGSRNSVGGEGQGCVCLLALSSCCAGQHC